MFFFPIKICYITKNYGHVTLKPKNIFKIHSSLHSESKKICTLTFFFIVLKLTSNLATNCINHKNMQNIQQPLNPDNYYSNNY